jgi:hypothetical protein
MVSHQKIAKPMVAATTSVRKIRRSIHQSITMPPHGQYASRSSHTSLENFLANKALCGNKIENPLF